MQEFYNWSELVSRCERNGIDSMGDGDELSAESGSSSVGTVSLDDIGEAAIMLCDALDGNDAMWTCKELAEELRGLEGTGGPGSWI